MISTALFLCMHVALWTQEPEPPRLCFTGRAEYTVDTILDAATVILDQGGSKLKVALLGVKSGPGHSEEAKRFLVNLLKGERVYVLYDRSPEDRDEFGRTLAYLHRAPDGLFVNLEIVRQGYCRTSSRVMFRHFPLFKAYEEKAMKAKKGMWSVPD